MKSVFNNKIKYIVFAIIAFVCVSLFLTINTHALNENIDTNVKQTVVIVEGEELSLKQIFQNLTFGDAPLKNATLNSISLTIGSSNYTLSNTSNGNTKIMFSNSAWGLSETKKSIIGDLDITFTRSGYSAQTINNIPVLILYNNIPSVSVPHIYVSNNSFIEYQKITNNDDAKSLYQYIKNQIVIEDIEESYDEITIYGANNYNSFDVGDFKVGTTTMVCVSVNDKNKSVSVPCYITILEDETLDNISTSKVRSISKEFYPYYRENIKKDANGYYYAKKIDGIYYYVDKSNQPLQSEDGKQFAVDACLSASIGICVDTTNQVYQVIPKSKWITNGNCMSLLTNCLTNTDTDDTKFIESWKFDNSDVKTIKKSITDGNLDKNFYYNYISNGYCETGSRKPNEMGRVNEATSLGENTGLVYYISNDTLYIVAKDISNSKYTYEIPDYNDVYGIGSAYTYQTAQHDVSIELMQQSGWTYLKSYAPWSNYSFSKVVLDDKITKIGNFAFYGLTNITEPINIPKNCTEIGAYAFMNCVNMSGNIETKSVAYIGDYAFANCKELKGRLYLGSDATYSIGNGAFMNCGFTQSLSIPSSVMSIGKYAFMNCKNFTGKLVLSNNLTTIGEYAFAGCSGFDGDLVIPDSVKVIEQFTFAHCYGFNGVIQLGNGMTKIGDYAFYDCHNLSGDVILPDNLETIGVGAFKNCRNLKTTIVINAKLKKIESEAFANCFNITTINNDKQNKTLTLGTRVFYINTGIVTRVTKEEFMSDSGGRGDKTSIFSYNFAGDHRVLSKS